MFEVRVRSQVQQVQTVKWLSSLEVAGQEGGGPLTPRGGRFVKNVKHAGVSVSSDLLLRGRKGVVAPPDEFIQAVLGSIYSMHTPGEDTHMHIHTLILSLSLMTGSSDSNQTSFTVCSFFS